MDENAPDDLLLGLTLISFPSFLFTDQYLCVALVSARVDENASDVLLFSFLFFSHVIQLTPQQQSAERETLPAPRR